ncbi:MAG: VTT domain-containing protein [Alphaproteobacteria bacterium]|nr:VTT domain-containing protein [Alphaproteobacteria bacterium]
MPIAKLKRHPRAAFGLAAILATGIAFLVASHYIDTATILRQSQAVSDWVAANPIPAVAGYFLFAVLGKIGPVPGGLVVMLSGGFLFGGVAGALLSAIGGGLSAMLVTVIGRRFFENWLLDRHGSRIVAIQQALGRDIFWVVVALRLTPITPAWFGNLVPIPLPIHPLNVWVATALGVLPISFVVASLGSELQSLTEISAVSPGEVFTPQLLLPLFGLAALSLLPIFVRRRLERMSIGR